MSSSVRHDVIIVGLGPTGLALATLLGRRGLKVLVLEREPAFYGMARAVYTDDETLRVFQTAGVADELHADMNVGSAVQWRRANGTVLAQFREPRRPLWWPISNFFYQPFLENKLEELLKIYPNVHIRRGREVTNFDQSSTGVTVQHAPSNGSGYGTQEVQTSGDEAETATAEYLVGADGGRSVVRMSQGIDMTGKSFSERWLVVDLESKEDVSAFTHLPYFDFICDPAMPVVSCPQPARRHRFEFSLSDEDSKDEFESDEVVNRLLSKYVNTDEVIVTRRLVYTFNALIADRWRAGRILLAGDAAHMSPQFVGQGMNAGIRDADNLSWKLHAVLRQGASPALLDTYETERRPHVKAMTDFSVLNKSLVSIKNPFTAQVRDMAIMAMFHIPGVGAWIRRAGPKPKPRFRRGEYVGMKRSIRGVQGTLSPQPEVRTPDGRYLRLDDALGDGWAVIGFGIDPRTVRGLRAATWDRVDAKYVALYPFGARPNGRPGEGRASGDLIDVEDTSGSMSKWLRRHGAKPGDVLILRPDKYVFGLSGNGTVLTNELIRQMSFDLITTKPEDNR